MPAGTTGGGRSHKRGNGGRPGTGQNGAGAASAGLSGAPGHRAGSATNTTPPARAGLAAAHAHGAPATIGSFPSPVVTIPLGERQVGGQPAVSAGGLWEGSSLQAATRLSVPIALGALVVVFVVVQWLIDRRDPKFVEAPARKDDDSIGFD